MSALSDIRKLRPQMQRYRAESGLVRHRWERMTERQTVMDSQRATFLKNFAAEKKARAAGNHRLADHYLLKQLELEAARK